MTWIRRLPPWALDLAEALVVGTVWFAVVHLALRTFWYPLYPEGFYLTGLWLVGVVALRRVATTAVFWITLVFYPFTQTYGLSSVYFLLPLLVAGFAMARYRRVPVLVVALATAVSTVALVSAVRLVVITRHWGYYWNPSQYLIALALALGAVAIGATVRRVDQTSASLRQRNEELRVLHEALARQAVVDERARIARELHDVVAHHVSAIVVRAQAADRVADRQPQAPREAVAWIAGEGKTALTAMRSIVHVLRADAGVEFAPTPASDTAQELRAAVERVRETGRQVRTSVPDSLGGLSAPAALAVVRIAQEALTNVLLHSGARLVDVTVAAGPDRVTLVVHDAGPAAGTSGGGNGLVHMRERAAACGGTVAAGPDRGGWTVHAEIPRGL